MGDLAVYGNIRAHTPQFVYIAETLLPDIFGNNACPLGESKQRSYLRLHISGKSRMRSGLDIRLDKRKA